LTKGDESREADIPFGTAAVATLQRLAGQLMENLPGTLGGEDIEALHDMRVASRRLRAALRIFKPAFPKKPHLTVESKVKSITGALGTVRDSDVLIEFLQKYAIETGSDIRWLIDHEHCKRETARVAMTESLIGVTGADFMDGISALLASASLTSDEYMDASTVSFCMQAQEMALPRIEDLLDLSVAIGHPENAVGLHSMRIGAKRLRYTIEPFAPYWGRPLAEKITVVKSVQEYLGQIHDLDVWTERLRTYASEDIFAPHITELSKMISDLQASRADAYAQLFNLWEQLIATSFFDSLLAVLTDVPEKNLTIPGGSDRGREQHHRRK
jgi:CHAD domain-containing protein